VPGVRELVVVKLSTLYVFLNVFCQIMRKVINVSTHKREELVDITGSVKEVLRESDDRNGLMNVYVQGATAAIMVQENWDESVQTDVVHFLRKIIPQGVWLHDQQDGNGDSHLKAGLVGPSETIPIIDGQLGLSTWQNIFLCEFDGPRTERNVVCTIIGQ
jgi:secondary thiamine-phosphate synthase enzyme